MANWKRFFVDAFWTWDQTLGGQRRPTRIQKWVARRPVRAGLCATVPVTLLCLTLSREKEPDDLLFAVSAGLSMGVIFGLTAFAERLRQRRLKRLGIGDGS
ncbi:hypothetical protein K7395_17020 [Streptomyces filamentosus]|uniref:Uncharacterized protein n=2 Tax=Streptomyces filamentosus TaxID=67294 RepID=A0ABY4UVG3_STRFL|nr:MULTISPECIES: hypothetical protein [Streptomyces]EFE76133.1 predicted protein [Streptomyces filamentosus NRRL 15998]EWS93128.1 hypothetical protein SSIG_03696 [Streptomyces filamentosus NRRL 11379]MYR80148.1 hypothetical protein [Streptomyces sp. SID5466]USC48316.1 hypothetical protein K7395_17020 [Streptomyces filamentosus]